MRTLTESFVLLIVLLLPAGLFAETPAPLGRMLASHYSTMRPGESAIVFVYLKDKGPSGKIELYAAGDLVSARSIARREKVRGRDQVVTAQDLPVDGSYISEIAGMVVRSRHALRWFNAVSVEATKDQIDRLRKLPYVKEIELVGRWTGTPEPEGTPDHSPDKSIEDTPTGTQAHLLNYGTSLTQEDIIDVPNVHDMGIFGEGVMVGIFDNGFRLLTHEAFASMDIVAQYDFVDHKVSVIPNAPEVGYGSHGVNTLSTIGGYKPGSLIGPAFRSRYVLARTENDSSETPVEEDNWAAAIEWADSIGIDVATTSLGYTTYDVPYTSWTPADMDGNTTVITQAADLAVGLGIVVVNSAGNGGGGSGANTLGAPADGDSVIAVGSVTSSGIRSTFSSVGPTTDVPARIKPDIMAQGSTVYVASSTNTAGYGFTQGTSFSCPLSAGVAALILSAHPGLTPMQVRDALRNTASNAASPNNQYGWGIIDADSAIGSVGIIPMARLTGTIYHDLNGNGEMDGGEPGLVGESVFLVGADADTVVSGIGGAFLFDSVGIGEHTLSTTVSAGWIISTPVDSLSPSFLHRDSLYGYTVGLFEPGVAAGTVFFDSNDNGVRDSAEAGLPDWTIVLTGPVIDSAVTGPGGEYFFSNLPGGNFNLSQIPQPEWLQNAPPSYGSHAITVTSGFDSAGLDFGDIYADTNIFPVSAGWNLLSLPVEMLAAIADSIYPNALSSVSLYDSAYHTANILPNGRGYWAKFPTPQNIQIEGLERLQDTVTVVPGWNLIGSLSEPVVVGSIVQDPPGIVASKYYGYVGNAYIGLEPESSLIPHEGYWVKCSAGGILILEAPPLRR